MGRETKVPWCHHTFNGVRGCEHATLADGTESPGCHNCYAEGMSKRNPKHLGVWGEEGTRILGGPDYWANLDRWHRAAVREGVLRRVFCYSLADVFESPKSLANLDRCRNGRMLLWDAIERLRPVQRGYRGPHDTPIFHGLIFLLLTKRPENVKRMVPATWLQRWPQHVWLGTSVENQQAADERIPRLLDVPGVPIRFLSLEPLLERVELSKDGWLDGIGGGPEHARDCNGECRNCPVDGRYPVRSLDWLIPGGEGLGKRPCDLAWIRDIRDQGKAAGVPVFVKQMGSNPVEGGDELSARHPKGEDPDEWPEDLRVREVPEVRL